MALEWGSDAARGRWSSAEGPRGFGPALWAVRLIMVLAIGGVVARPFARAEGPAPAATAGKVVYIPFAAGSSTGDPPALDEAYGTLAIDGTPETRPAAEHPDLNLAIRGYEAVSAYRGLVDYGGEADPRAPQLAGLLGRAPEVRGTCRVYDWDWDRMARAAPIASPPVTLVSLAADRYAIVRVPDSGRLISEDRHQVLVLYADTNRITLKYTREDSVVQGYTLHIENVRVAPDLLELYRETDGQGRRRLPALRAGQALGWAAGDAIGVAIRDVGSFMDPRSRKDWWQGF